MRLVVLFLHLVQPQQVRGLYLYGLGLVGDLVNADQLIGQIEHVVPQRYDYELSILRPLLYVVGHYRYILEVQSSVDFVHEVEGSRLVVVEGEYQRK